MPVYVEYAGAKNNKKNLINLTGRKRVNTCKIVGITSRKKTFVQNYNKSIVMKSIIRNHNKKWFL